MRNGLKMVALLTLLGSRSTIAQSKGSAGSAAVASANHIASSSHAPDATRFDLSVHQLKEVEPRQ